jgi:sn-glycerol 3-phosphate transport system permease protein
MNVLSSKAAIKASPKCRFNSAYLMVFPAILGCAFFMFYPILFELWLSFQRWDMLGDTRKFIGLRNYVKVFSNPDFLEVVLNSCLYMTAMVGSSLVLALSLALWLNSRSFLKNLVQSAIFSPYVVSMVSISILWMWIMEPDTGLLNYLLDLTGVEKLLSLFGVGRLQWLESESTALFSLIVIGIWKSLGYNTLILIAGLQGIPKSVCESALLDRAGRLKTLFRITIPLLSPSLFFLLIVNATASFQVFDSVHVLTQGGPLNSSNMLVHWIYQTGFEFYRIGEASVGAVMLIFIVGGATYANFRLLSKQVHYQ